MKMKVINRGNGYCAHVSPGAYSSNSSSLYADMQMSRMLAALSAPTKTTDRAKQTKRTKHPSAPRKFSWEA